MFLTSTEAQLEARERVARDAAQTLLHRLSSYENSYPVSLYALSRRQCRLMSPSKHVRRNERILVDSETIIQMRVQQLVEHVKCLMLDAGVRVNCEEALVIERSQLVSCNLLVVRIGT